MEGWNLESKRAAISKCSRKGAWLVAYEKNYKVDDALNEPSRLPPQSQ
jgi:hypothetical protein